MMMSRVGGRNEGRNKLEERSRGKGWEGSRKKLRRKVNVAVGLGSLTGETGTSPGSDVT